ncbi:MAG: hypothetical protein HY935_07920 [Nitrosomonadales bacterium]|nr:hypothetical protein [Nitrosomonadales bacterium]
MDVKCTLRKVAELGLVSTVIATMVMVGCGGGGSSSSSNSNGAVSSRNITVTPLKGKFGSGTTVLVKRARDGVVVASATIGATGNATVGVPISETGPFLIEAGVVGDNYFDESTGTASTIPASATGLRALIPDTTSVNAVGVTALTEIAVGQIEAASGGMATATAADVIATNITVGNSFGIDDPLSPPSLIDNGTQLVTAGAGADRYALTLAALAKLAAPGKTALEVIYDLRNDAKDGVLDGLVSTIPVTSIDPAKLSIGAGASAASMVTAINTQMGAAAVTYAASAVDLAPVLGAINTDLVATSAAARQLAAGSSATGVAFTATLVQQMQEFNSGIMQNIAAGITPSAAVLAAASTTKPIITSMLPVSRGAWDIVDSQLTQGQTTTITANWSLPAGVVVTQMELVPVCSHGSEVVKSIAVSGAATTATISWPVGMGQGLCPGWYNGPLKINVALTYSVNGGASLKLFYNYNSDDVLITSYSPANFAAWNIVDAPLTTGQTTSITANWVAPAGAVVTGISLVPVCSVQGTENIKTGTVGANSGTVSWPVGMGVGLCPGADPVTGASNNPVTIEVVLDYTVNGSPRRMVRRY